MTPYRYTLTPPPAQVGLVVLQSDLTIEGDLYRLFPASLPMLVTRVPSGVEVTPDSLDAQAAHLTAATALLPHGAEFASIGYGCTSGTAQIGARRIADLVHAGARTAHVTEPVSALIAACAALGVTRLGILSPYIASVSDRLRAVLAAAGIATPVFGSFLEAEEARVARIDPSDTAAAARDLADRGGVEALFLSCTNLRTLPIIDQLESETGLPVLSSNLVLAWHMARLAGLGLAPDAPGRLMRAGHSG